MERFRFNKIKWDKILSAALVIVLLVGCVAGLTAIFNTKTTEVSDFEFKTGKLDPTNGLYKESDTSIYTKDLIECQGLIVEPDFEATGKYQVFYYDNNKTFVGATDQFDAHLDGFYEKGNDFISAQYCRIVIFPDTPSDNDGYAVDDWKIHFWEVAGYADDYKITVNKKQNYKNFDLFEVDSSKVGYTIILNADTLTYIEDEKYSCCVPVDVTSFSKLTLDYAEDSLEGINSYAFVDANGRVISGHVNERSIPNAVFDVPEGAVSFVCSFLQGTRIVIFGER